MSIKVIKNSVCSRWARPDPCGCFYPHSITLISQELPQPLGRGRGGLLFNKVTDLQSRLSSPRSSKRSVENMPIELLGHYVDHKILECVWQALTLAGWFAGSRLEGNLKAQTHWWATTYQSLLLCHLPLPASRPKTCTWTHHKIDSWWKTGI